MNESDKQLIPFLRKLADKIENNSILPEELKSVGDFFIKYRFINNNQVENNNEFSKDELMKFICLGWYIYNCILKNESIN